MESDRQLRSVNRFGFLEVQDKVDLVVRWALGAERKRGGQTCFADNFPGAGEARNKANGMPQYQLAVEGGYAFGSSDICLL